MKSSRLLTRLFCGQIVFFCILKPIFFLQMLSTLMCQDLDNIQILKTLSKIWSGKVRSSIYIFLCTNCCAPKNILSAKLKLKLKLTFFIFFYRKFPSHKCHLHEIIGFSYGFLVERCHQSIILQTRGLFRSCGMPFGINEN